MHGRIELCRELEFDRDAIWGCSPANSSDRGELYIAIVASEFRIVSSVVAWFGLQEKPHPPPS